MNGTELHTARLVLRRVSEADPVVLNRAIQDPRIYRNVGTIPPRQSLQETIRQQKQRAARSAEGKGGGFCVYLSGELIGLAGGGENDDTGVIDFGYWISPDHWGKGYATEAASAVLSWFVKAQFRQQFTASYFRDNPASGRVLEKLGFGFVRESRHFCAGRNEDVDAFDMVWSADDRALQMLLETDLG